MPTQQNTKPSRVAALTLAALATFGVAGPLSGLLIDERGGALDAVEWLLRTLVVVSAAVVIAGGSVVVLRLRRRMRPRPVGWVVAALAWAAFAWFAAVPLGFGVYLSHLPGRVDVRDADLGTAKQSVVVDGADGHRLRGWYVPSRNGAAVLALHGTGSSRLGVVRHSRMLARHGYGVLALDLRGHGESDGRSTSTPWKLDDDLGGALDWLAARPDVRDGRIGAVGVSLGGEVALHAAAKREDLRAVVAEGLSGGPADARRAGADPASLAQLHVLSVVGNALVGAKPDAADGDLVARVAPRPLLLVSAGRATEAAANRAFQRAGGATTDHWSLPDAAHGSAIRTEPRAYERRVVGFLDRALR